MLQACKFRTDFHKKSDFCRGIFMSELGNCLFQTYRKDIYMSH